MPILSRPFLRISMSSLERAVDLLRILAQHGGRGARLQDIAQEAGVARPSVHRLLATLKTLDLVEQDDASDRSQLGLGLYLLGQAAADRFDLLELARPFVEALAWDTGDTTYLTVRHRYESICLLRCEGSFPIKAFTTQSGARQPLGLGAGSIALLAFLDDAKIEDILQRNHAVLEPHARFDMDSLLTQISQARANGYILRKSTVVDGITTVAVPVFDYQHRPAASVSLTAIDTRMDPDRLPAVVQRCKDAAQSLQERLAINRPEKKRQTIIAKPPTG